MKQRFKKLGAALTALVLTLTLLPVAVIPARATTLTGEETTIDVSELYGLTEDIAGAQWTYHASYRQLSIQGRAYGDESEIPTVTLTGANSDLTVVSTPSTTLNLVLDDAQINGTRVYIAYGSITIQNGSTVSVDNSSNDYGIYAMYAQVVIDDSTVTASGGLSAIYANQLDIRNGSTVTAQKGIISRTGMTISDSTVNSNVETGSSNGIRAGGDLTIQNSRVSAQGCGIGHGISAAGTLQITGGTVTAAGGVSEISATYGLNASSIVIRKASVSGTFSVRPTDGAGESPALLYKTTLSLPEAGASALVTGTAGTLTIEAADAVKTDAQGLLYLWLPEGEAAISLIAGGEPYTGNVAVTTDDGALWPIVARTVIFDAKGGSDDPVPAQTEATGKLASLPTPTASGDLAGYAFAGWYTEYYGGEQVTTDTFFLVDATVYARWVSDPGGVSPDASAVDVSRLTADHTEGTAWSYSAEDKTLTVTGDALTLTGTNANLHVDVTAADANLTLSGAGISAGSRGKNALSFTAGTSASNTLTIAAGTENTLTGGIPGSSGYEALSSTSKLTLAGTGKLTAVSGESTSTFAAAIDVSSAELTVDGPAVTSNGCHFGLSMGSGSVARGTLEIKAGSLTLNKTNDHYDQTLESNYDTGLTVNVRMGTAFTVNNGGTTADTTINNYGGTVYIDGDVNGTANNDESGGTFTVTGGVTHSSGTISRPVLAAVTINLANLAQAGTDYYELATGSDDMMLYDPVDLTGYTVIRIKQPGDFTLTGAAPANFVLLDESSLSRYTLSGCSLDGLVYDTRAVTVTGTNTLGAVGIPVAGGGSGTCSYSGTGTLNVQNSSHNPECAFPANEEGIAVVSGCVVVLSGYVYSDGIRVTGGSLTTDGWIGRLEMSGGSAEIRNSQDPDDQTDVTYTGGTLLLQGKLDSESTTPTLRAIFNTNGGSTVPNTYLWGYDSYQVSVPSAPEKDNSQFTGWYTDELLNTPAVFPATITGTQNYYAAWQAHSVTISDQPTAKTVAYGSAAEYLSVTAQASNGAALSYQWYRNDSAANTGGTLCAGATDRAFCFPTDQLGTGYYYCVVSASGCEPVASNAVLVTVEKASYGGSTSGSFQVRSGVPDRYTYSLPNLPSGLSWGTPTTGGTTALFSGTPTVNEGSLTFAVTAQAENTEATIFIPITGANYNDSSFTLTVTAVNKTSVAITGLTAVNATYGGTPHSGYTGTVGTGLYIGALDYTYAGRDGTIYTGSNNAPTNAGDYTVTVSVPDTDPDYMGSVSLDFTIAKRPVTVKADNKSMFMGGTLPTFTYTVDGQLTGETALVGTPTVTSAANGQTAGSFDITVDMTGVTGYTANYEAAAPAFANGKLTVSNSSGGGGGGGSIPTAAPSPTVSGSTATTAVTPAVKNGAATASVPASQMRAALTAAQKAAGTSDEKPQVEIKLENTSGVSSAAATIPQGSMQSLVSGNVGGLTVSSGVAALTFDADALAAISGAASGDVTISASQADASALTAAAQALVGNHPVYEFSVTSGGNTILQFNGTATVSVPYALGAGENPNAVIVSYINAGGNLEIVMNGHYDAATGTVTFTTTHFSKYAVGYNKIGFTDVADSAWCAGAVTFLSARGITSGTTNTTFSPGATLTRGQFITLLLKAYGIEAEGTGADNFSDAGSTYYTGYLAAAKRLGISSGVGDNKFAPEQAISRQQMFTLLYNALKALGRLPDGDSGKMLSDFTDSGRIASYAQEAMTYLVETGVAGGNNGYLLPESGSTRAQMAQVLYNLLSK